VKVSLWNPVEYAAEGLPEGWPAPGRLWSPERGSESIDRAFELFDAAVDAGFDMVSVAEHHCGYGSLTPSPIVMAAALAQRYADVEIGILGPILPLAQPLRVAEEIAMVDLLSGGRTLVGFFRGIANEFLAYGTAPAEGAEMLREAVELVVAAWTEPEPFGWEGRHYRHRSISVWPRPLQTPHPPVLLGATSPESASWAAARGFGLGVYGAVVTAERAAECVRAFREASVAAANPREVLYRAHIYIAESDEDAQADVERYELGNLRLLIAPEPKRAKAAAGVAAALFGPPRSGGPPPRTAPEFSGGPESVLSALRESQALIGWDRLDCVFTFPRLPHHLARRSLELFSREVLPGLRQAVASVAAP
jgi:alkanesulfonate monooxygenase SsuD/methylene tetrahydromethanopterin reductase-like flavin-dependent oxidoreductase (luciferase family)